MQALLAKSPFRRLTKKQSTRTIVPSMFGSQKEIILDLEMQLEVVHKENGSNKEAIKEFQKHYKSLQIQYGRLQEHYENAVKSNDDVMEANGNHYTRPSRLFDDEQYEVWGDCIH